MLKGVGMAVPKSRETRVVYMPQDKRLWQTTIIPLLKRDVGWLTLQWSSLAPNTYTHRIYRQVLTLIFHTIYYTAERVC